MQSLIACLPTGKRGPTPPLGGRGVSEGRIENHKSEIERVKEKVKS